MAYVDRDRSREKAVSSVVAALIVGGMGYALVTGLAMTVFEDPEHHLKLTEWAEPAPPPPIPQPPDAKTQPAPRATPADNVIVPLPVPPTRIDVLTVPLGSLSGTRTGTTLPTIPTPPTVDRSAGAMPRGNPGDWVLPDDYPAAALRAGSEGRTGFRLDLGIDGRVTGCTVTASSGSDELDRAACRILTKRGRFTPARDADGRMVAGHYASSVVWRVPRE